MVLKSALTADVKAGALRSPALLSAVTFLVVAYLIRYLIKRSPGLDLPVVQQKDVYGPKELLEASRKVSVIEITTSGDFNTNLDDLNSVSRYTLLTSNLTTIGHPSFIDIRRSAKPPRKPGVVHERREANVCWEVHGSWRDPT